MHFVQSAAAPNSAASQGRRPARARARGSKQLAGLPWRLGEVGRPRGGGLKEGVYRGPRAAAFKVGLHVAASGGVEWEPLLGHRLPRGGVAAAKDLEKEDHDVLRDEARGSVSVPWTLAPPRVRRHKMLGPSETLHDNLYAL